MIRIIGTITLDGGSWRVAGWYEYTHRNRGILRQCAVVLWLQKPTCLGRRTGRKRLGARNKHGNPR